MKTKRCSGLLLAALLAGCASEPVSDEPITWSAEWFACESRFQCVAVYDAFCKHTGVNIEHLDTYQDWAQQQVLKTGEHVPCPPQDRSEAMPPRAYCRDQRCEYP